eukprot:361695_1
MSRQPPNKKRKGNNGGIFSMAAFAADEADEGADDDGWDDENEEDVGAKEFERHRLAAEKRYERRTEERTLNADIPNRNGSYESRPNILDRLTQKYVQQNNYAQPDDMSSVGDATSYQSQSHN